MLIKELVIDLENKPAQLYQVVSKLSENGIDIKAVTCIMVDNKKTKVKIISMNLEKATRTLTDAGFKVRENQVIIVDIEDRPGELAKVLKVLADEEINIEYVYTTLSYLPCRVLVVFDFTDPERGLEVLKKNQITVVTDHNVMNSCCGKKYYEERNIMEYLTTVITP